MLPGQPGSSCIKGSGRAVKKTGEKYCDGTVGHGTSDQFKHHLYNEYEAKVMGNPGNWCDRISDGIRDRDVCIYQAFFVKKIRKK